MSQRTTLTTVDRRQRAHVALDGRAAALPIPCFQCGVCCMKWQPLLAPAEIRKLAADVGLTARTFRRRYVRAYPLRRGWGMLRTGLSGGCVFLAFAEGRSSCSIYEHRPEVCRAWGAGLDKRECVTGLERMGGDGLLTLETLYEQDGDRAEFAAAVTPLPSATPARREGAGPSADGHGPAAAVAAAPTAS